MALKIYQNAFRLISFLNSDVFLQYLQKITGIKEKLISDPYLSGGGYHEIKKGGFLKIHADFNKHPFIDLDRRVNVLLYLNKNWNEKWGGNLELYVENNLKKPELLISPIFNRCVIFNTNSHSYHGHPDLLSCPENISRKSIALYYFSRGRPFSDGQEVHTTLFREAKGEKFTQKKINLKKIIQLITPPIIFYFVRDKLISKINYKR